MTAYVRKFETGIVVSLIVLLALVLVFSTIDLLWRIVVDLLSPPFFLLDVTELFDIFGLFLLVLIGLELFESIKAYLTERHLHVEIVLDVALIAIARKVIILDLKAYSGVTLLGIAALVITLAGASYLERHSHRTVRDASGLDSAGA